MFFGIYLIIINGTITGNVVGIGEGNLIGSFGFFIFFIGILFIFLGMTLERKVESSPGIKVYMRKGISGNRYFLRDSPKVFSLYGEDISLQDFEKAFDVIKDDDELSNMAREVYGSELIKIAEGNDREQPFIAMKFLNVLYEGNIPEIELKGESRERKDEEHYNIIYDVDPNLSLEKQGISGRLKNAVDHMEYMLMKGGDPGIRSHSMGGSLRRIYEARHAAHGGPRVYYARDQKNRTITVLGYSTKNNAKRAEEKLESLYGRD